MNEVLLPWPDKVLSPNARVHWAAKAKAAKAERNAASLLARQAGLHQLVWPEGPIWVWITGFPADKRRKDADNLLAALKPSCDSLAEAMGVDDSRFRVACWISTEIRKPALVRIRFTTGPEGAPQ